MSHFLSLVIAALTTAVGLPLAWYGGGTLMFWTVTGTAPHPLWISILCVIGGALLLLGPGLCLRLSRVGALVVGAVTVIAALALQVPPVENSALLALLGRSGSALAYGALITSFYGLALVVGVVWLLGALTVRRRSTRPPLVALSMLQGLLAAGLVLATFVVGADVFRAKVQLLTQPTAALLLQLGLVAAIAATLLALRWSSAVALTGGVTLLLAGIIWWVASEPVADLLRPLDSALFLQLATIAVLSLPLLVGAALLGVGIGNRHHSRSPAA